LPLIDMLKEPKQLIKVATNLGAVVLLVVISYLLASSAAPENSPIQASPATWKMVDTGLIMLYITAAALAIIFIAGGVMNAIKNR